MTSKEAAAWLSAHNHFCILTHRNPDGDTIGCACALCGGLRSLGKEAVILKNAQFTHRYAAYLNGLTAAEPPTDAVLLSVDMASEGLLPDAFRPLAGKVALAIDHHGSNTRFAPNDFVVGEAAACGELIYELLLDLGAVLTPAMADALYLAVSTDTGCFQYANTTAQTLRIAAALKDAGAEAAAINKIMFGTKSLARLQLEARLTGSLELLGGGLIALCRLPLSWMRELGLSEDDIDSISGFPRAVEGVSVGVMLRELTEGYKISMRTGPDCNASDVCAHLGGGGHKAAAGATIPGTFAQARAALLDALEKEGIPTS